MVKSTEMAPAFTAFLHFTEKKTDKICPFFECGPARLYIDSFSRPIVPQGTTEVSCKRLLNNT